MYNSLHLFPVTDFIKDLSRSDLSVWIPDSEKWAVSPGLRWICSWEIKPLCDASLRLRDQVVTSTQLVYPDLHTKQDRILMQMPLVYIIVIYTAIPLQKKKKGRKKEKRKEKEKQH